MSYKKIILHIVALNGIHLFVENLGWQKLSSWKLKTYCKREDTLPYCVCPSLTSSGPSCFVCTLAPPSPLNYCEEKPRHVTFIHTSVFLKVVLKDL